jgi:hypothetical protein
MTTKTYAIYETMINATEAKAMVPAARIKLFEKEIRRTIKREGGSSCFVRFIANEGEIAYLSSLGYKVWCSSNGATHISWVLK